MNSNLQTAPPPPPPAPLSDLELATLDRMVAAGRTPRLRSVREFAEAEVIIPDGPFQGRRFRCDRQPLASVFFDAIQHFRRNAVTGVQQSGKTLLAFVIVLMYHLFEVGETVLCGVPSLDIVDDKWRTDILPAINASRYKDLLPRTGEGSRGGAVKSRVDFTNGATLRFMTGGGDDQSRAAFTSRVLVVTEVNGFARSGHGSVEADQLSQLEGRTRAYGSRARIYLECTAGVEDAGIWPEYVRGTQSRLALRCPHCRVFVTPEREHLVGWQEAADILDAGEKARIACPKCGAMWDEQDRRNANADAVLVHRGQEIDESGTITGELPRTDTLGFRWSATNNMLVSLSDVAQEEWRAARSADEENGEKKMRQWFWALPHKPAAIDLSRLDAHLIARRQGSDPKGKLPIGTRALTVGIDLGKWLCHWAAVAWKDGATGQVIEYGAFRPPSDEMDTDLALLTALRHFRDEVLAKGFDDRPVDLTLVDSGWFPTPAYAFTEESGTRFLPSKGFGTMQESQGQAGKYREAKQTGSTVVQIGEGYHVALLPGRRTYLVEVNADAWKTWVHERLTTPVGQVGAMTLYKAAEPHEHLRIGKHLTAEKRVEEFVAGKGTVTVWRAVHRDNHLLDAVALASVAGHGAGQRLISTAAPPPPPPPPTPPPPPPAQAQPVQRPEWFPEPPHDWKNR